MLEDSLPYSNIAVNDAIQALQQGGLVAIPTETVYGLAADATNIEAIQKIYVMKNRPANHPLIVHLAEPEKNNLTEPDWLSVLTPWARDVSEEALRIIFAFWPGPLTLVFKKDRHVLNEITGGQDTVALRSPAHPVAQELLRKFGKAVVAPSANRFGKVSPTSAADVRNEFTNYPDLVILDGGDCDIGIESTIVDLSNGDCATLLRPGAITPAEIFKRTGVVVNKPGAVIDNQLTARVSGSFRAHYAPTTPLRIYSPGRLLDCLSEYPDIKTRVAVAVWDSDSSLNQDGISYVQINEVLVPAGSVEFANRLYRVLRDLDQQQWDLILFPEPPSGEEWDGVRDRLQRACFGSGPSLSSHSNN